MTGESGLARKSDQDRRRWDERYADSGPVPVDATALPAVFGAHLDSFPVTGYALEIACGQGRAAVWLARRGMTVHAVDASPVAIGHARALAMATGVAERCRFDVADLDDGLPAGVQADLVLCHRFRDARLDGAIRSRLAPAGLLAICVLSEVGAAPGPFRARAGELRRAFVGLEVIDAGEADGEAWLLARS